MILPSRVSFALRPRLLFVSGLLLACLLSGLALRRQEPAVSATSPMTTSSSASPSAGSSSPLPNLQGAAAKQYLISLRLADLEQRLPSTTFLRIHRSHLINLEYVASIESYDSARVEVVMKSGARIVASRTGSKRLRDLAL